MLAVPALKVVASPALSTVATLPLDEVHVALLLMFCVLPSLKVPVAANCWEVPAGTDAVDGETAIDVTMAEVTVRVVLPVVVPEVAEMVTSPGATVVTKPVLSTAAIVVSEDVHVTPESVCVPLSVNRPVALNCAVFPSAKDGEEGEMDIDTRAAGRTLKLVLPVTEPEVALIVTVPVPSVVAVPAASMEATPALEDVHVTDASCWLLPLLNSPIALNG